jgi:hypothetical protein
MPKRDQAANAAESAREEAMAKSRVAAAYKEVFGGLDKERNAAQQIVWDDLQKVGSVNAPVFTQDANGALCGLRAAHVDGRRWVWLYIQANVTTQVKVPN